MELTAVDGFEPRAGFQERWWDHRERHYFDNALFVTVRVCAEEIARIELDLMVDPGHYAGVPPLGACPLEIQLMEVRGDLRGKGLGTEVVEALASSYPGRRLIAFSEGADGFWASLGWSRHLHRTDREPDPRYRPLYVQP